MKKLFVKLFRDIWQTIGQFISILLVIAVGCFFFAGMISSTNAVSDMIDDFYTTQNMADYWGFYYNTDKAKVEEIRNNEKVNYAEGRFSIVIPHKVLSPKDNSIVETKIKLQTLLENVNKPLLYGNDSRLPEFTEITETNGVPDINFENEAILDRVYAEENNIKIGDVMKLKVCMTGDFLLMVNQGGLFDGFENKKVEVEVPFKITGLFDSPEYLYRVNESGQAVERHKQGYMQIREESFLNIAKVVFYDMCKNIDEVPSVINEKMEEKAKDMFAQFGLSAPSDLIITTSFIDDIDTVGKLFYTGTNMDDNTDADDFLDINVRAQSKSFNNLDFTLPQQIKIVNGTPAEDEMPSVKSGITSDIISYTEIVVDAKDGATMTEIFGEDRDYTDSIGNAEIGDFLFAFSFDTHQSATAFDSTYTQIANLVSVFPLIFFLVAGVITFISMSKMVENQRMQIGIMQALGIKKSNIYVSYLGYAFLAGLFGSILGGLLGILLLPKIYYGIFEYQFVLPPVSLNPSWLFLSIGVAVSLVVSCTSAFVSCHKTLREIPASALRPKPPKKTKKIFLEKFKGFWKRLGFKNKIIIRNIFLNKTRILLSSFGVIGCVTLLIAGCGVKSKIDRTLDTYFNSMNYDISITYDKEDLTLEELKKVDSNINDFGKFMSVSATYVGSEKNKEADRISLVAVPITQDYINITNLDGDKITFNENTVAIPFSFANENKIKVGDEIVLSYKDVNNKSLNCKLVVTDITEQYGQTSIYISNTNFEKKNAENGGVVKYNVAYIRLNDNTKNKESVALFSEQEFVTSSFSSEDMKNTVSTMLLILNIIVVIIVVGAAVLAMTVIYNITSINVFERRRELATLKVLGCYKSELNHLVMAENMVITAIGCLIGLPIGILLYKYLIKIIGTMQFTLTASLSIWVVVIAFAVTFVFSILATLLLTRKMHKIDMVEALKGAE